MISPPMLATVAVVLAAVTAPCQDAGMTPIQVAKLRLVAGVYPSPDGKHVAFTRSIPRLADDAPGGSRAHLYLMPAGRGDERLVIGGKNSARGVSWSPDGQYLCHVAQRDGDRHAELWGIPVDGGPEQRVTKTPHGLGSYRWRPDGKSIAYSITDRPPERRAQARAMGFRQKVVDEDYDHISLWTIDLETGENHRLTEGVTVNSFEWSPTGTHLAAGIAPRNLVDDSYMFNRLHVVVPGEGRVEKLVDNPGKLGGYAWSPDGETLAYLSAADPRDPHAGMLYTIERGQREPKALTPGFRGMVHQVEWHERGGKPAILATISTGVKTALVSIDPSNGKRSMVARQDGIAFRTFARGGRSTFAVGDSAAHPGEVFRIGDASRSGLLRMTNSNPWLDSVALAKQRIVRFASVGGIEIEGLLIEPLGLQSNRRYPLVIHAHGGPESHFSDGWLTAYSQPGQVLAARGYACWFPNYRSSTGYGVEFAKYDHGDPMGDEFGDHLAAIHHFAGEGLVDPDRVGVIGGSYGGYTAAWAATAKSAHIAAAVSFVPFVDIRTKWYTSDIPWEFFYVHYQEKWPHEQRGFLDDRSPLSYADQCRTPLLLLGGTSDPRVHPSQPFMLYRAVKSSTDTPCRYVQYPGEGHGNRRNVYRYDYLLRGLRWLEHYLRPGDHRGDAPPPFDLDYSEWTATAGVNGSGGK